MWSAGACLQLSHLRSTLPLHPWPHWPAQGRLPEIEELQRQITAAHEELAEASFRAAEERNAVAAVQQALTADKVRQFDAIETRANNAAMKLLCCCSKHNVTVLVVVRPPCCWK